MTLFDVAVFDYKTIYVVFIKRSCVLLAGPRSSPVSSVAKSLLREPGFEYNAAVSSVGQVFVSMYCSSSLNCMNEYLDIDSTGYLGTKVFSQ